MAHNIFFDIELYLFSIRAGQDRLVLFLFNIVYFTVSNYNVLMSFLISLLNLAARSSEVLALFCMANCSV